MLTGMQRITHSCGHEQEHYIIGEYAADYDRQAAKLARVKCASCLARQPRKDGHKNHTKASELGLATLQGSPKQIAWAETIRNRRLSKLRTYDSEAIALFARITDAKWWIDRRSDVEDGLVASAASHLEIDAKLQ